MQVQHIANVVGAMHDQLATIEDTATEHVLAHATLNVSMVINFSLGAREANV